MGVKKYFEEDQVMADVSMKMKNSPAEEWNDLYNDVLDNLKPGLNELIVHLAIDNAEMQAVASEHQDYGSQWRQNDLDYLVSDEFKNMIEKNNIILIGWREIKKNIIPGFKVTETINRFDYDLTWDSAIESSGLLVRKEA